MDRKVPKTMALRNKNALKVPESGTPEVSNHLVRMRSPYPLVKDIDNLKNKSVNFADEAVVNLNFLFPCAVLALDRFMDKDFFNQGIQQFGG